MTRLPDENEMVDQLVEAARFGVPDPQDAVKAISRFALNGFIPMGVALLAMKRLLDGQENQANLD